MMQFKSQDDGPEKNTLATLAACSPRQVTNSYHDLVAVLINGDQGGLLTESTPALVALRREDLSTKVVYVHHLHHTNSQAAWVSCMSCT